MEKKRIHYNTTLGAALVKKLKLSFGQDIRQNELLEEAIQDLLRKYDKKGSK